jgi:hypothetical protein
VIISVPACADGTEAKPNAKIVTAIELSFFHMIDAFLLFRGLNQRIAAKLPKSRRGSDRLFRAAISANWARNFHAPADDLVAPLAILSPSISHLS